MRERTKIRDVIRKIVKDNSVNAFAARTSGIEVSELPLAIITIPDDDVKVDSHHYMEREMTVMIELIILPENNPETEIEQKSEDLIGAIRDSKELLAVTMDRKLRKESFAIESHGKYTIAASEIILGVSYMSTKSEEDGKRFI